MRIYQKDTDDKHEGIIAKRSERERGIEVRGRRDTPYKPPITPTKTSCPESIFLLTAIREASLKVAPFPKGWGVLHELSRSPCDMQQKHFRERILLPALTYISTAIYLLCETLCIEQQQVSSIAHKATPGIMLLRHMNNTISISILYEK